MPNQNAQQGPTIFNSGDGCQKIFWMFFRSGFRLMGFSCLRPSSGLHTMIGQAVWGRFFSQEAGAPFAPRGGNGRKRGKKRAGGRSQAIRCRAVARRRGADCGRGGRSRSGGSGRPGGGRSGRPRCADVLRRTRRFQAIERSATGGPLSTYLCASLRGGRWMGHGGRG